jgi:hypothetical protein
VGPLYGSPQASTAQSTLLDKLSTRIDSYSLNENSFIEALLRVGDDFHIPLGVAWVNTTSARLSVTNTWKGASLQEIIEWITNTQPGYQVSVSDGVVHILSSNVPSNQNFLFLKIDKFAAHQDTLEVASANLRKLVKRIVSPPPPQLQTGGTGGSIFGKAGEAPVDLQVNNATVEQILDSLAKASTDSLWVVTFSDNLILTPTGYRRTSQLRNKTPIPEDEQPVWDYFRWDDRISSDLLK